MVKVLFKSGDDYVDANGKVATPEEVEAHLSSVESGVDGLEVESLSTAELVDVDALKVALEQAQKDLTAAKTASDETQGKYDVLTAEKTKWLEEKANLEGRNTTLQGEKTKLKAALEQAEKDLIVAKKK